MSRSISRIMDQIERLQKQAAAIQQEAIIRIRKEIAQLGLTQDQLFGDALPRKVSRVKASTKASIAKFSDEFGNTWGGIGKRPEWLRQALAAGKSLEDFLVNQIPVGETGGKRSATKKVARKKSAPRVEAAAKSAKAIAAKGGKEARVAKKAKAATPSKAISKPAAAKKTTARKAASPRSTSQAVPVETAAS